jgi:hypothetical protein
VKSVFENFDEEVLGRDGVDEILDSAFQACADLRFQGDDSDNHLLREFKDMETEVISKVSDLYNNTKQELNSLLDEFSNSNDIIEFNENLDLLSEDLDNLSDYLDEKIDDVDSEKNTFEEPNSFWKLSPYSDENSSSNSNRVWYRKLGHSVKFVDALALCSDTHKHAKLAEIHSENELNFLNTIARNSTRYNNAKFDSYWVGAVASKNSNNKSDQYWLSGSPVIDTLWRDGWPRVNGEHVVCVVLHQVSSMLQDIDCTWKYEVLCEIREPIDDSNEI